MLLNLNQKLRILIFTLQIVQLTASGNFEEALSLCKLLPPEDSSLRAAKEGSIHIRLYAIMRFFLLKKQRSNIAPIKLNTFDFKFIFIMSREH